MTPFRFARACAIAALALIGFVPIACAQAQPQQHWEPGTGSDLVPIPPLTGRVNDLTQTLTAAERSQLEAKLADWEGKSGNQLAVLIVPTTQPEPIEAYSIRVAEAWKIGRKGQDNGVLLVVAKNDRKVRLEVGYGLEGSLTDLTARRIIAEDIAPKFREGNFAAGLNAGIDRVIEVVGKGEPLPPPKVAKREQRGIGGIDFGTIALLLFLVVPVAGAILRSMFGRFLGSVVGGGAIGFVAWLVLGSLAIAVIAAIFAFFIMISTGLGGLTRGGRGGVYMPGGGWGGGGGSGGGFGGGSSGGGFSGGGGSFGGGGASGNW